MKMIVPSPFAQLHVDVINGFERLMENLSDMKLFNTDPIVALGGMSKFSENANSLQTSFNKLATEIAEKINN
jgi:hypothetical protein